ncbi:MAG: leucine-rich repeat domain-containing protein [Candidatus Paceibacterota bacterium]|jgi:leucine-rich repeat protein SHOC2
MGISISTFNGDDEVMFSLWEVWKTPLREAHGWTSARQWINSDQVIRDASPLRRIIHLHLRGCLLTGPVPSSIGQLSSLQHLDLRDHQLTSLPPEIGCLSSLQYLDLGNNALTGLPLEMAMLSSLQSLDLARNQLKSLPPEMCRLSSLRGLYLNNNELSSLPSDVGQISSLRWLDLYGNQLTSLTPEIGQLSSLLRLDLRGNRLECIPPEIGQLSSLQELYLDNNQLTSLPPEISHLSSLRELCLSNNQLTSFPPEVRHLSLLQLLTFDHNQLVSIPSSFFIDVNGSFPSLQRMSFHDNCLIAVPHPSHVPLAVDICIYTQRLPTTLDARCCSVDTDIDIADEEEPSSSSSAANDFTLHFYTDIHDNDADENGKERTTQPSSFGSIHIADRKRLAKRWPYFRHLLDADLSEARSGYADLSPYFSLRLGQCLVDYLDRKTVNVSSLQTQDCRDFVEHANYFGLSDTLLFHFCTAKLGGEELLACVARLNERETMNRANV